MKRFSIFWDLDDTLIPTQEQYSKVKDATANLILNFLGVNLLNLTDIMEVFNKIDIANANSSLNGFSKDRFPLSWGQTYYYFCQKYNVIPTEYNYQKIYNTAKSIFEIKIETFPNVCNMLSEVKSNKYEMNILTLGDTSIQNKRIDDAGIRSFFDNIYVVKSKDPATMKKIIGPRNSDKCIVVGNSLKSDIYPSLSNGISCIHIDRQTWSYDHYEIDKKNENYFSTKNILEVPKIIEELTKRKLDK